MNSTKNTTWAARAAALGLSAAIAGGLALVAAPAQAVPATTQVHQTDIRSNEDTYPGWHQGYANAAADAAVVGPNGLELHGESQILNGYAPEERVTGDLGDVVQTASWTTSSGVAFFQVPLFYGDTSIPSPKFTTLRPAAPASGANSVKLTDLWATSSVITDAGGAVLFDKNAVATLQEFVGALETPEVLGFGVLSEAGSHPVVSSVSFQGRSYAFTPTGAATLMGQAIVGSTIYGSGSGFPEGSEFSNQWFSVGDERAGDIDGATGFTYTPSGADFGLQLGVRVTATLSGYVPAWVQSPLFDPVIAGPQPPAPAPVADSAGLPAFLAANGVTPGTPASVGLPATLNPAATYTATAAWPEPDAYVDVYLYSSPIVLGTYAVVDGQVQIALTPQVLSKLAGGSHTLLLVGQNSGTIQAVSLSLAASTSTAALADTGSDVAIPATLAGLLVLLGAAGVLVARRRRATQA